MVQTIRSRAGRVSAYLRRVLVEQPQRNGWLETLVSRLIGTSIAALLVLTFCLMVDLPPVVPVVGVLLSLLLVYGVEWVSRWRIRRRVNR